MFSCEFAMRIPVARWLLSRGLAPVCEVQSLRNCDMVGVRFETKPTRLVDLVAVELKLTDVASVMRQCESHMRPIPEVWAAMPINVAARHASRFRAKGIGVLGLFGMTVIVLAQARRVEGCDLGRWFNAMRRRRNEYVDRMKHPLMLSRRTLVIQGRNTTDGPT